MNEQELLSKIKSIKSWKSGSKRAPHKPLLILYALGRLLAGQEELTYKENYENLSSLLEEFGPPTKPRPNYPFLRLSNDRIWSVDSEITIDTKRDYSNKVLFDSKVKGSFTTEVKAIMLNSPELVDKIVLYLLENNFPFTWHKPILESVGLEIGSVGAIRKPRNPDFRRKVLEAYERSCAVCGYQIRRDDQIIGLEAAHVKWHSAGGPDNEQNGMALCILHHELFDRGLFSLNDELLIRVSRKANGNHAFKDWLLKFHGQPLRKPQSRKFYPEPEFLRWQVREVFKGYSRD